MHQAVWPLRGSMSQVTMSMHAIENLEQADCQQRDSNN